MRRRTEWHYQFIDDWTSRIVTPVLGAVPQPGDRWPVNGWPHHVIEVLSVGQWGTSAVAVLEPYTVDGVPVMATRPGRVTCGFGWVTADTTRATPPTGPRVRRSRPRRARAPKQTVVSRPPVAHTPAAPGGRVTETRHNHPGPYWQCRERPVPGCPRCRELVTGASPREGGWKDYAA